MLERRGSRKHPWRQEKYKKKYQNTTKAQKSNKPRPPALRAADGAGGRGLFDFCVFVMFCAFISYFFLDVRDVFGIRGAQAWESTFRLLRMNVQGCHYILAVWFTYRIEDHDGFRPGAPSLFLSFFFVFMVKILDCFFLNICVPPI